MPLTKITSSEISTGAVTADKIANNVTLGGPKITTVNVANSAYTVLDDTAVNIGGGYIVITGSGFESGAQVIIDTTTATSVAYVNNTTLRAEVPSKSAASYNLYVVNPDGGTAIRVNGLTYSANPTWVTASPLDNWSVDVAANVAFSATGATSYSNTTALPAGTQLLSNGYFYGTVTGISVETQYTFTVRATDAENQESDKSFSVTVTVGPPAGQLWSWGRNDSGQLGHNNTTYRSSPVQVGTSTNWVQGAAELQAAIIKSDGTLWSWGNNNVGRLGLNDTIYRSSPVQVGSSTNWSKIFLGGTGLSGFFGIKTDNTLWTWGFNLAGRLGLNNTADCSSPTQVGTNTWSHISANDLSIIGVRYDGTLWSWGNNPFGVLGLNNTTGGFSSPVQVGTDTNWSKSCIGGTSNTENMAFGLKTNGTLWSWGYNYGGLLGLNTSTGNYKSSPTQIGTDTNWAFIPGKGSNYRSMLAIKSNGTLWSWGTNISGACGLNDTIYRSSPTQVGSDTTWSSVELISSASAAAIKTNDTLWTWGSNLRGQLGLNDAQNKSSPTQVGTTGWKTIMLSADNITMAIKQ